MFRREFLVSTLSVLFCRFITSSKQINVGDRVITSGKLGPKLIGTVYELVPTNTTDTSIADKYSNYNSVYPNWKNGITARIKLDIPQKIVTPDECRQFNADYNMMQVCTHMQTVTEDLMIL